MTAARLSVPPLRQPCDRVLLNLPEPTSTNALTRNVSAAQRAIAERHGKRLPGRLKTEAYQRWLNAAGWELQSQRPGRIEGKYELTIAAQTPKDIGNLEKACSDLLQEHGVVSNDSEARDIRIRWDESVPPRRILVTLKPWGGSHVG
jgi:Holliday junction resolvase RusA-like endonuclease